MLLAAWSVGASGWWIFAGWLVAAPNKRRDTIGQASRLSPSSIPSLTKGGSFPVTSIPPPRPLASDVRDRRDACPAALTRLSVFKPIPPVSSPTERAALAPAIASFLPQLGPQDEMLIGVQESEAPEWLPTFSVWRESYPGVRLIVCQRPEPRQRANPKIAWLEHLAEQAHGELWLWSDADIVAPAGCLDAMKRLLAGSVVGAVTSPYCVREIRGAPEALDALFVNAEFLPGALLLGRMGTVDFTFGAATMFRAADFRRRVTWADLGASLADDYVLGQRLQPVLMTSNLVETGAFESGWPAALRHYYRWQKTIRWCRPGSFAALLAIQPLVGWAGLLTLRPQNAVGWAGLGLQWFFEVCVAIVILRRLRCRIPMRAWLTVALWPVLRVTCWMAVWLPLPVIWRGTVRRWTRPRQQALTDHPV